MFFFFKPKPILITSTEDLRQLCDKITPDDLLAFDTEFMRERTFYPVLCLIQLNFRGKCYIIDPLAPKMDLRPILKILADPKIIKVFHSARADFEVLAEVYDQTPQNVFDTQTMSNLCGFEHTASYSVLTKKIARKKIDKHYQRSNWQKRPLTREQINYAMEDVLYLPKIYHFLHKILQKQNKLSWLQEETRTLCDRQNYGCDYGDLNKRFMLPGKSLIYQKKIAAITAWRNDIAKSHNVPRSFVIKDPQLKEVMKIPTENWAEIEKKYFHNRLITKAEKEKLLNLLQNAEAESQVADQENMPKVKNDFRLNQRQQKLYERARVMIRRKGEEHKIFPELLIIQSDLRKIILGHKTIAEALYGWRAGLIAEDLEKLLKVKS